MIRAKGGLRKWFERRAPRSGSDPAITITVRFVIAGIAWIIITDSLVNGLEPGHFLRQQDHIHVLKGIFFIGVAAGALFYVLHHYTQALRTKEEQVEALFHSSPNALGLVDGDTFTFYNVNELAIRKFGFAAEEFNRLRLQDLAAPGTEEKFETVLLLIRSGFKELGVWKLIGKRHQAYSIDLVAQRVVGRKAYLIYFFDVTRQLEVEQQLKSRARDLETRIAARTHLLEQRNEDLAYRASQAEQIYAELIEVNEQLQIVSKKVAAEGERWQRRYAAVQSALEKSGCAVFSFPIKGDGLVYVSEAAEAILGYPHVVLCRPWFWKEYALQTEIRKIENATERLRKNGYASVVISIRFANGFVQPLQFDLHATEAEDRVFGMMRSPVTGGDPVENRRADNAANQL